jgi:ubiquitin carboxyl-terminal hydrolase 7
MSQKVADHLKHESIKLRFTTSNANGTPKSILKRSLNQTISDIIQPHAYNNAPSTIIFYERLDVSIVELETKRSLKIIWTGIHNKEEVSCC